MPPLPDAQPRPEPTLAMSFERTPTLARTVFLSLLLAATWLVWSGLYKPLLLALGVFSCAITIILIRRMRFFDEEIYPLHFSLRLVRFWLWLGKEIWSSSIEVARVVLHPKLPISPRTITIESPSQHNFDQVMLGNSITLTPGTLTLDVYDGKLKVHTLTDEGAKALLSGEMASKVTTLRRSS